MKRTLLTAVIAVAALSACRETKKQANSDSFQRGTGGIYYRFIEDADGEPLKEDEFAAVTYVEKTASDSVITNTRDFDGRVREMFRERSFFPGDLHTALGMMSEGDSAEFKIRLDSTIARTGRKELSTVKGEYLIYQIRVHKTIPRGAMTDEQYDAAIHRFKDEQTELARKQEAAKLDAFLASLSKKPQRTPSGMFYLIDQAGNGPLAKPGDTVKVNYAARFLSGRLIETTVAETARRAGVVNPKAVYEPLDLLIGPKPGSGFDEAMVTFPAGTKVRLFIPSRLAYREDGRGLVRPYTALQCELEILAVKRPK